MVLVGFFCFVFQQAKLKLSNALAVQLSLQIFELSGLQDVGCLLYFMGVPLPLSPLFKIAIRTRNELFTFLLL